MMQRNTQPRCGARSLAGSDTAVTTVLYGTTIVAAFIFLSALTAGFF